MPLLNQSTYNAAAESETEELLQQNLRLARKVWNHGMISQHGDLLMFPLSTDVIEACKNDQHDIGADEMTSDDEDLNFDTMFCC